jgi:hypothetical protein
MAVILAKSFCTSIDIYGTRASPCDPIYYYENVYNGVLLQSQYKIFLPNTSKFCEYPVDYFRGANGHNFDREFKALTTIAALDHSIQIIH